MNYDVIIIGAGPAGLSAAIYLARAKLKTLLLGKTNESQLALAPGIENFFGFPKPLNGPELLANAQKQAALHGAILLRQKVTSLKKTKQLFTLTLDNKETHTTNYLIIATGIIGKNPLDFAASLKLKMNKKLIAIDNENKTSLKNCFAIGNCTTKTRQLAKDVGDGCNAAITIIREVQGKDLYLDYGSVGQEFDKEVVHG